ncbi:sensor histidine kinase [Leeuwenhoekiella sp. MAR_2009_132]|uniref:sensor histidine kinase n=1 Tax=Leeuwenhoekiella sp. MAR_2009_132 TaxID=1392489 RepID=UPI00048B7C35|nr:ATP-binding protein [Leeuwenhoekiella sp. MAR_2009_132]
MNTLLNRQIRKHLLSKGIEVNAELNSFLSAVDSSYTNYEEQLVMVQRAMSLSSDELSAANLSLKKEMSQQQEIIQSLTKTIATLHKYGNNDTPVNVADNVDVENDGLELARVIDNQTREIIASNEQRDKLLEELERQNKELNDYAHIVSHDLKSPLNSINALTSWIIEDYKGIYDDNCGINLNLILEHVEHMNSLIEGVLEYSSIDKNQGESYEVDLNEMLMRLITNMSIPDHFTITVNSKLPVVTGNSYRFQQLFQNLIQNAIKYNDKESGTISIDFIELDTNFQFSIADNGIGIEANYFDKIFQPFQTLENDFKSKGIGLSIVLKIIKFYKGSIWLESELNTGTTFYFTLPKHYDGKA